jgi:glyoxylase-like metal-dependent hydrolase (beta-lactamase superfamily II)
MPYEAVLEGVFQVGGQGLSGPGDCCVYLIDAGDGASVLVDAGLGSDPEALMRNIEDTGHRVEDVRTLVLTHCHIDHIGGASLIVDRSGCEVVAHEDDRVAIEEGIASLTAADVYGIPSPEVDVTTVVRADGGTFDFGRAHVVIIHTPGHTPGDISLELHREGKVLMFANDVHGPFSTKWGSDINAWRRSMNRLIAKSPDILLEGHYGVIQPKAATLDFFRDILSEDVPLV